MTESEEARVEAFKIKMGTELEFCNQLFREATVRLLAAKYCYYIKDDQMWKDYSYDVYEKSWWIMGMALGLLNEDEFTPCIDFDIKHPLAQEGIALASKLMHYKNE